MKNLGWIGITASAAALTAVPLMGVAAVAQHEAHSVVAVAAAHAHTDTPAEAARTAVVTVTMNGTTTELGEHGVVSRPSHEVSTRASAHEVDLFIAVTRLFFGAIWH